MAKRKRLTPRDTDAGTDASTTSSYYPLETAPKFNARAAPIAQVAGNAAAQAALEEIAHEMQQARQQGLMVVSLPLEQITEDHLVRDRIVIDGDEMDSLRASLLARGQQNPIEVVDLGAAGFGLISGWRRMQAFRALYEETGKSEFAMIKALIKPLDTVSDSYVAMVEENEIRANLSFYERAHLACEAVRLGIYPTPARAVQVLFANAKPARRSKILAFVRLHDALGSSLSFPAAIPEKLGLALVSAVEADNCFGARLKNELRKSPPETAREERAVLERALRRPASPIAQIRSVEIAPGIRLDVGKGRVVLRGRGVTEDLQNDLAKWLSSHRS